MANATLTVKAVQSGEIRISKSNLLLDAYEIWSENDNRDRTTEEYKNKLQSLADVIYKAYQNDSQGVSVPALVLAFNDGSKMQIVDGAFRFNAVQLVKEQHPEITELFAMVKFIPNPYSIKDEVDRNAAISKLVALGITSQTFPKDPIAVYRIIGKMLQLDPKKAGRKKRIADELDMSADAIGTYVKFTEYPDSYKELFLSKFAAMNTIISAYENGVTPQEMVDLYEREGAKSGVGTKGYKVDSNDIKMIVEFKAMQSSLPAVSPAVVEVEQSSSEEIAEDYNSSDEDYDTETPEDFGDNEYDESSLEESELDDSLAELPVHETVESDRDELETDVPKAKSTRGKAPGRKSIVPDVMPTAPKAITRSDWKKQQQEEKINKASLLISLQKIQDMLVSNDFEFDGEEVVFRLTQKDAENIKLHTALLLK